MSRSIARFAAHDRSRRISAENETSEPIRQRRLLDPRRHGAGWRPDRTKNDTSTQLNDLPASTHIVNSKTNGGITDHESTFVEVWHTPHSRRPAPLTVS